MARGQNRAAVRSFNRFLRWHPHHSEARFLLGGAYGGLREWELALEQFRQVPADSLRGKDAAWRIGDVAMMLHRAADAEAALRRSLELDPESLEAYRGLITIYRWQDRELAAEPLVWRAYDLTPPKERPLLMAEWFRFHFAQRPVNDTFTRLSAFLMAQPDDVHSAVALGVWSLRQRRINEARVLLETVFKEFPDHPDARAAWASYLLEMGEGGQLESVLKSWPEAHQDVRYWRVRGAWLQDFAGDYAAALECLQRWLAKYPDDWQTRFRASTCLRQLGRTDEAQAETDRAEKLKEVVKYEVVEQILNETLRNLNRPEHRHRMGEFYAAVGYKREAKAWFEMALELDPQHEASRAALAQLSQ